MMRAQNCCINRGPSGVALITCLIMLSALMLASVAAAVMATEGERGARLERDRQLAFQAAEAALLDAERDIEGGTPALGRAFAFSQPGLAGLDPSCGQGDSNPAQGLCLASASTAPWLGVDLADAAPASSRTVAYGRFTGRAFPARAGYLPKRLPRYLIEAVPLRQAGAAADESGKRWLFRITAIGFGAHAQMQVVLQSYYQAARS